jgi:hypothetical protein
MFIFLNIILKLLFNKSNQVNNLIFEGSNKLCNMKKYIYKIYCNKTEQPNNIK